MELDKILSEFNYRNHHLNKAIDQLNAYDLLEFKTLDDLNDIDYDRTQSDIVRYSNEMARLSYEIRRLM